MSHQVTCAPQLVDARDAARILDVSERTLWRLIKTGQLPAPVRIGLRAVRWRVADLTGFVDGLSPDRRGIATPEVPEIALAEPSSREVCV